MTAGAGASLSVILPQKVCSPVTVTSERTEPFSDSKAEEREQVNLGITSRSLSYTVDYFQIRLLNIISRFTRALLLHSKFFAFDPRLTAASDGPFT